MATLSTTAWVLHELGLAAGFGGNLFGSIALHPALKALESKRARRDGDAERHVAWERYRFVNAASLGAMAVTWLVGRTFLTGREVGRDARSLVVANDLFVLGSVACGVTAMVAGTMLDHDAAGPRAPTLRQVARAAGNANVLFGAAVLTTTTALAMRASRPGLRGTIARLLR